MSLTKILGVPSERCGVVGRDGRLLHANPDYNPGNTRSRSRSRQVGEAVLRRSDSEAPRSSACVCPREAKLPPDCATHLGRELDEAPR